MKGVSKCCPIKRNLDKTTNPDNLKRKNFVLSSLTFSYMIYCNYGN